MVLHVAFMQDTGGVVYSFNNEFILKKYKCRPMNYGSGAVDRIARKIHGFLHTRLTAVA